MVQILARLLLATVLSLTVAAHAAEPTRNLSVTPSGERRVALIIGNSAYPGVAALKNPANDATDMAAKLRKLNFSVTLRTNVGQKEMLRALTDFGEKVQQGGEVLFFYAGHGMQVRGKNYLIPIDAEIKSEGSVSSEAVDVDQLLDKLAPARLSIVILDACRNNPFERRFRGSGQGLAQINAPTGTLIAYATAPGKVASDGDGRNGLYTSELLAAIDTHGIRIEDVFKRVRANVVKKSGEAQIPWESSSLTGDFFFKAPSAANVPGGGAQPAAAPADPATIELAYWDGVKDSRDAEAFKAYLDQYPDGRFAALAKVRMRELTASSAPGGAAAPRRTSATDFLEGVWEYQMPDNRAHVQVHWNPTTEQYEGVLMKHGEVSQWVGFVLGEVVWKGKLTSDPTRIREQQMARVGANGVSHSIQWLDGEFSLERSSPDELVTSFGRLRRVGPSADGARKGRAEFAGQEPVAKALTGSWVGRDGAWYKLTQNGSRMILATDTRPVLEDEVRSTYSLVGNVPITQPVHAEFQLLMRGNRLNGTWARGAIAADKCIVPAASAEVDGELQDAERRMVLRHELTSYKATTQMALLGDDSCSGVVALGKKFVEEVIYGPLGRAGVGAGIVGLTSWWDGGFAAIQFGWQGRLKLRVQAGSPAHQAGLRDEDEVLSIDNVPVKSLSAGEAMLRLHGEPRSSVVLDIRRKGASEIVRVTVQRI